MMADTDSFTTTGLLRESGARDVCEDFLTDEATVDKVAAAMPGDATSQRMAELFGAMGDPTRLRLLLALSRAELCVCDLSELLGVSVSAVSHQLRLLRALRLVKFRRQGRQSFYSLDDFHVEHLIRMGLDHVHDQDGIR